MSGMRQYVVEIPGITPAETVFAEGADAALAEALWNRGLNFAPPGTTVTDTSAHGIDAAAEA